MRIPEAIRIAAPAPAWTAAPAGATGSTADADEAQPAAGAEHEAVGGEDEHGQDEPGDEKRAAHDGRSFGDGA